MTNNLSETQINAAFEANKKYSKIPDGNKILSGEIGNQILTDLEEKEFLKNEKKELQEENIRDGLTGVNNRAFWDKAVAGLKDSDTFTVMLIDVDDFKSVNDTFGHAAGDKVLISIARLIDNHVKLVGFNDTKRDVVARYGGEEFAILLPELNDSTVALRRAEEIRKAASELVVNHHGTPIERTLSIGIAVHTKGETPERTIELADISLYRAKELGKNRAIISNG